MKTIALTLLLAAACSAAETRRKIFSKMPTVTPNIKGLPFAEVAAPTFTPSVRIPGYKAVENCGPIFAGSKIVGGEIATAHEFPWQVGMFMDGAYFCGGSILNEEWVLTAAHCTDGHKQIEVIAGAQLINEVEATQVRQISTDFFEHPNWNSALLRNDLALIHLPEPLTFNEFIAPVCLPKRSSPDLQTGDIMTSSGWGKTSDSPFGGIASELHKVTLPVKDHDECAAYYGSAIITDSVVCLDTEGGHGNCNGDSGGPLTWVEEGRTVTRGITSFVASAGCLSGYPDGDTKVKSYLDWIETETGIIVED